MRFYFIMFFLSRAIFPFAQQADEISLNEVENCAQQSKLYQNYYNRYDFYEDYYKIRPTVTIPININVWQKNDSTGNWRDTEAHRERLKVIIDYVNAHYRDVGPPSDTIAGVISLQSAKLKFELNEIYFYRHSDLWGKGFGRTSQELNAEMLAIDSSRSEQFNIHITGYSNPKSTVEGYSSFPSYMLDASHFVVTFHNKPDPQNVHADFAFSKHLTHELGHTLDLRHTYAGNVCEQTDPDYLDDVFGRGEGANCPHTPPRGSLWGCNPYSPDNSCTNNLMGGTRDMRYLSPKQIYRIHRALSLKSIRRYVKEESYGKQKELRIRKDEHWDFDMRLYNPIRVKKGVTLTITCHLTLGSGHYIHVEKGGKLIIEDGGLVSYGAYTD